MDFCSQVPTYLPAEFDLGVQPGDWRIASNQRPRLLDDEEIDAAVRAEAYNNNNDDDDDRNTDDDSDYHDRHSR